MRMRAKMGIISKHLIVVPPTGTPDNDRQNCCRPPRGISALRRQGNSLIACNTVLSAKYKMSAGGTEMAYKVRKDGYPLVFECSPQLF